jgi:hypothetical protein
MTDMEQFWCDLLLLFVWSFLATIGVLIFAELLELAE